MIMWCETLPSGKVRFAERYEHPLTGKQLKVSVTMDKDTKSTRKQAQLALQCKIDQKLSELNVVSKKKDLTFSELIALYREDQKVTVSKSTYQRNFFATKSLMEILGKDTLVERMTAGYVRKQLSDRHEKPGTTNERLTRLKALLRWGYNNDYISDIRWIDKLSTLKDEEKSEKLEEKYLESDDLKRLLDHISVMKWKFLAEFTALSGLRCGEAIALEMSDIDTKNRIISVTKTFDPVNNIVTTPKTKTSYREVYMQDELLDLCKKIKVYMSQERLVLAYRSNLFFSDINGDHVDYYAYNKCLKETAERILHKNVTSHFMRHTHVALMAEQGVPLEVISRRLGHANSSITRDIYFHVTKKLKERDNAQIKEVKIL